MSENARRNFKKQAPRLWELRQKEERTLLSGTARNRVSGAGKHLRYLAPKEQLHVQRHWVREEMKTIGLPHNISLSPELTEDELRRVKGWIRAARDHRPAMVVLESLYSLGSGRGVGSPVHAGDNDSLMKVIRLWPSPLAISRNQAKMFAWWVKADRASPSSAADYRFLGNRKLLDILSKVKPLTRWCIITHPEVMSRKGVLTHRSVNWEFLSHLSKRDKLVAMNEDLRTRVLWGEEGFRSPKGLSLLPRDVPMAGMRALSQKLRDYDAAFSGWDPMLKPENFDSCLRIALMFGKDIQTALRYVEDFSRQANDSSWRSLSYRLHNAAQKLPLKKDAKRWRNFVLSSFMSPIFGQIMDNLDVVEEVCGGVPINIGEVRDKFHQAGKTWDFDLNSEERSFIRNNPHKYFETCPHAEVVDGDYRLVKLGHNDTQQLTAGRLVDCCQHLNGAGASCAAKAWTSGYCAIYAVFKADRMVAQTFAWRSDKNHIVFDSVEALSGVNRDVVLPMFAKAAEQIVGQLGICKVLVGDTSYGITLELNKRFSDGVKRKTPSPLTPLGYSDAKSGCYTLSSKKLSVEYLKGRVYTEDPGHLEVVNTLMPGSEVYCEHCDAEVHPACQICPSCGRDISEWVD